MLVSVGMPVYNRPEGLERALKSLLKQTYSELEIIISNDHSPNPLIDEIARRYSEKDKRIKYFYQEKSLRTVQNFSFVKKMAKGKYFLWLADDDWLEPNYIEECVFFLEVNPEYQLTCGNCYYQDGDRILNSETNVSHESNSYKSRIRSYFRNVSLNGYFYGVMRSETVRQFSLPDELGFDWSLIGFICYKGKIKVLPTTGNHLTTGGMSNEGTSVSNYFASKSFISRNFIGLATSLNCAKSVFKSGAYLLPKSAKLSLALMIFRAAYRNVFMWDVVLTKRRVLKLLGISKTGVIFKS